jgi:hypothetical protein
MKDDYLDRMSAAVSSYLCSRRVSINSHALLLLCVAYHNSKKHKYQLRPDKSVTLDFDLLMLNINVTAFNHRIFSSGF